MKTLLLLMILSSAILFAESHAPDVEITAPVPTGDCQNVRLGEDGMYQLPPIGPNDSLLAIARSMRYAVIKRGNVLSIESVNGQPTVYATLQLPANSSLSSFEISPDENSVLINARSSAGTKISLLSVSPRVQSRWSLTEKDLESRVSVPGTSRISISDAKFVKGTPGVVSLSVSGKQNTWINETGNLIGSFPDVYYSTSNQFCLSSQTVVTLNNKGLLSIQRAGAQQSYSLGDKKYRKLIVQGETIFVTDEDGKSTLFSCTNGQNLGPATTDKIPDDADVTISPDGKFLSVSHGGKVKLYDLAARRLLATTTAPKDASPQFSPDGSRLNWKGGDRYGANRIYSFSTQTMCVPQSYQIESNGATGSLTAAAIEKCTEPYDSNEWQSITPPQQGGVLSTDLAVAHLHRFQTNVGLFIPDDLPLLTSILASPIAKQYPSLVAGALQNVLIQSLPLYESLLNIYPFLKSIKAEPATVCENSSVNEARKAAAMQYLNYLKNRNNGPTKLSDWQSLAPLGSVFKNIPKTELADSIGQMARSMAAHAETSDQLKGVFQSSIVYFAKDPLYKLLGHKGPPLTDILLVRDDTDIEPVVLGTEPPNGASMQPNDYGFYSIRLPKHSTKNGQPVNQSYQWSHAGGRYTATLQATPQTSADLVYKGNSFPYQHFWADGNLEGMIMVGANTRGEQSAITMDQYLNYFRSQGFTFPGLQVISDFPSYLQQKVASNRLDYFLAEGHTAGNQRDVMRIEGQARLMTGTRTLPDGRSETINLVFPTERSNESHNVTWSQFGQWMKARGQQPFAFFNLTCSAANRTAYELEHAANPNIINVPNLSTCYNFMNRADNQIANLLTGFRGGLDFNGIRQMLRRSTTYEPGKRGVIFPDEEAYQSNVTSKIKTPYQVNLEMVDGENRPYRIEDYLN